MTSCLSAREVVGLSQGPLEDGGSTVVEILDAKCFGAECSIFSVVRRYLWQVVVCCHLCCSSDENNSKWFCLRQPQQVLRR